MNGSEIVLLAFVFIFFGTLAAAYAYTSARLAAREARRRGAYVRVRRPGKGDRDAGHR